MTVAYCKRLIEVDLPIKRISAHARREKSIRHGHISTLHIWWARRPLAACRAVICASLWPDPADPLCPERFVREAERILRDRQRRLGGKVWNWSDPVELREALLDFIADFADWDNSNNKEYLAAARGLTQVAHEALGGEPGTRPLVVDPFAGGGAIPLEALRVGADAFASDLNPVASLQQRVLIELAPRGTADMVQRFREAGHRVADLAEQQLAGSWSVTPGSSANLPFSLFFARVIRCPGPDCGVEVPLLRGMCLSMAKGKYFAWDRDKSGRVITEGVGAVHRPRLVVRATTTDRPTAAGGGVTCPCCGYSLKQVDVARFAETKGFRYRLTAVGHLLGSTKTYSAPSPEEEATVTADNTYDLSAAMNEALGLPINAARPSSAARGMSAVTRYGYRTHLDLYSRPQLRIIEALQDAVGTVVATVSNASERRLLEALLLLAVDRQATFLNDFCRWAPKGEHPVPPFGKNGFPMIWDFVVANPFTDSAGCWAGGVDWIARVLDHVVGMNSQSGVVRLGPAQLPFLPDSSVDATITDPPYYDSYPYADLSDYFFPLLRAGMLKCADVFPGFEQCESPKGPELVVQPSRCVEGQTKDNQYYQAGMRQVFATAKQASRPDGISVVVFANKTAAGWEALLQAIVEAEWVVTASWPIQTEREARSRGEARLQSSIHLVCRPRTTNETGNWRDVLRELPIRIRDWLPRLAAEGVVGADAIFACLGPALEIFSRYEHVEKVSGETVTLREYLEHVWAAVSREALAMIFNDPETAGLGEDARLTAMWLWTLAAPGGDAGPADDDDDASGDDDEDDGPKKKAKPTGGFVLEYDAARKISQGLGCKLESLPHLVEVKGDKARLLPVGERTRHLFGKDSQNQLAAGKPAKKRQPTLFEAMGVADELPQAADWGDLQPSTTGSTVLDRIHQSMLLFAAGRSEGLKHFLVDDGVGKDVQFWKLAQALSALYPSGTDEKRWVDGVLARKKGLGY